MKTLHKLALPLCGLLLMPLAAPMAAQAQDNDGATTTQPAGRGRTVYIYTSSAGIGANKMAAWGNGAAIITKEAGMAGYSSVKVTTRGFYEGARFDLTSPIDLKSYRQSGSF